MNVYVVTFSLRRVETRPIISTNISNRKLHCEKFRSVGVIFRGRKNSHHQTRCLNVAEILHYRKVGLNDLLAIANKTFSIINFHTRQSQLTRSIK